MTNEQKANEIAENESRFYKRLESGELTSSKNDCQRSALEMAEWKDQQFIKFLEDRMGDEILVKTIEEFKEIFNG